MPTPENKPEQQGDTQAGALGGINPSGELKSAPNTLKLPQLTADERAETRKLPANENETLMLMQSWQRRKAVIAERSKQHLPSIIMFCGTSLSTMWLVSAVVYVHNTLGWQNVASLMPHEIGGFLAGLLAPVALFWMILTFWLRSVDVKLYAETLRQEIQAMMFPSEEAEKRVNNDIDRLMRQTAEMSRATRNALSTLQQARQAMHSEAQAMHAGARQTAERLEEVGIRLGARNEKLVELQKDFDAKGNFLVNASNQLVQDATQLDKTVNQTAETTKIIGSMLQAPLSSLKQWQDDVVDALAGSTAKIAEQQNALRVDIATIEEKATIVAAVLQKGTSRIYDFTDDALDKAKLIETRLQGQGLALEQVLNQINAQAEQLNTRHNEIMQELQDHTFDGQEQLTSNAKMLEQLLNQMSVARNTLKNTIDGLGETTTLSVEQLNMLAQQMQSGIGNSTTQSIERLSETMTDLNQNLSSATTSSVDQLTILADRLQNDVAQMTEKTSASAQKMQDSIDQTTAASIELLTKAMSEVRNHVGAATALTVEQLSALALRLQTEMTQTAEQSTTTAQQNLQYLSERTAGYVEQFSALVTASADHATEQSRTLLNETRNALTSERSEAQGFVDGLITQNKAKMTETAESFATLSTHINDLITEFTARQNKLDASGHDVVAKAETVRAMLSDAFARVSTTTQELEKRVDAIGVAIAQPLEKLERAAAQAADQAQITSNLFEQKITAMHGLGESLSETAKNIGQEIDDKARTMQASVNQIHVDMSVIKTGLSEHAQTLDNRVKAMLNQVTVVLPQLDRVNTQLSTLNVQTEQTHQNLVQLDDSILNNGKNLIALSDDTVNRVQQSLEQYAELGQQYEALSKTGLDQFNQAHDQYQKGIVDLADGAEMARNNVEQVNQLYTTLNTTLESLETQADTSRSMADGAVDAIAKAQDAIITVTSTLDAQTIHSVDQIEKLQDTLGQAHEAFTQRAALLKEIANDSEEQALQLSVQTQTLSETTQNNTDLLAKSTDTLRQTLAESGLQAEQVEEFNRQVATLNEQMQLQHDLIRDQAAALEKASHDAVEKATNIRVLEQSLQRDHFFSSAKFVVESLHSLALDFTRMLEGELPEKTWKAYQRGETSVFAKRLVSARDTLSHDKLRAKYADDVEFRTYVQRYMRQFEEMHDQAKTHDHGELLSSVFSSSDVGRLYQFLQSVLKS